MDWTAVACGRICRHDARHASGELHAVFDASLPAVDRPESVDALPNIGE